MGGKVPAGQRRGDRAAAGVGTVIDARGLGHARALAGDEAGQAVVRAGQRRGGRPVIGLGRIADDRRGQRRRRSEEHTSELQSLMRISYAVFCLKKKKIQRTKSTKHLLIQTIQNLIIRSYRNAETSI